MDVPWGSLAKGGQGVGNGTGLQGTGDRAVRVNRAGQVTGTGVSARAGLGTVHRDFLRSDAEGGPSLPFNHIGVQGYIGCRIWISSMAPHKKKGGGLNSSTWYGYMAKEDCRERVRVPNGCRSCCVFECSSHGGCYNLGKIDAPGSLWPLLTSGLWLVSGLLLWTGLWLRAGLTLTSGLWPGPSFPQNQRNGTADLPVTGMGHAGQ